MRKQTRKKAKANVFVSRKMLHVHGNEYRDSRRRRH